MTEKENMRWQDHRALRVNLYQADVAPTDPGLGIHSNRYVDRPLFMAGNVVFNPAGP
jgi:hypothetical protein